MRDENRDLGAFQGKDNLVWYENPTWKRHVISEGKLEAGGVVVDINGNGRFDVIAGEQQGKELYWFENPPDPTQRWTRRTCSCSSGPRCGRRVPPE